MAGMFAVNVEVAVFRGALWLMIERSSEEANDPGALAFPGGTVEHDDDASDIIEAAGRREVMEEVGLELGETLTYVSSAAFYSAHDRWVINVVLAAPWAGGEAVPQSADEVQSVRWMTLAEVESDERTKAWTIANLRRAAAAVGLDDR